MATTGFEIDWTWEAPQNEIDHVFYVRTEEGKMLVASNAEFDALLIADTEEEALAQGHEYIRNLLLSSEPKQLSAKPASLFGLATRWRWFIYNGKARFLCGGNNWMPHALAEYPGVQSKIAPDPMALVYYCRGFSGILTREGCPVVGGDVFELTHELSDSGIDPGQVSEFAVQPMFAFSTAHKEVWYRGRKHDLIGTMMRNIRLLAHHDMIDKKLVEQAEKEEENG